MFVYENIILDAVYKDYKAPSPALSVYIKTEDDEMINGDFYVSTNGNDANGGSKEAPFLTIEKAIESVRNTDKSGKNGTQENYDGDTVGPVPCNLYFNGNSLTTARYPNEDFLNTVEIIREGEDQESSTSNHKKEKAGKIQEIPKQQFSLLIPKPQTDSIPIPHSIMSGYGQHSYMNGQIQLFP